MDKKMIKHIVILAIVLLLLEFMILPINILTSAFLFRAGHLEDGVMIHKVLDEPSKGILNEGEVIYQINDRDIIRFSDISEYLDELQPGDMVSVKTNVSKYVLTLSNRPTQRDKAYMGVAFTPNYKERNVPIIKEILIKTPQALLYACIVAILVYSVVFIGLRSVLLAFFGPISLITALQLIRLIKVSETSLKFAYPGFKVLVGITLLLIMVLFLFVVPSVWIKKDDKDCFKKILIFYFTFLIFNSLPKIYYGRFILIDVLLLPISYTSLVLWSIILKRIFQKNLAV